MDADAPVVQYDFIRKNRGFGGFVLNATLTDIFEQLASPVVTEFAHVKAPVPRIGGITRVYVVPNISITTEITGLSISKDWNLDFSGEYGRRHLRHAQLHEQRGREVRLPLHRRRPAHRLETRATST